MSAPAIALTSAFTNTANTFAFTGSPAVGDLIVVVVTNFGTTYPTFTDNATGGSNSYSRLCGAQDTGDNNFAAIYSATCQRTASGLTVTSSLAPTASYQAFTLHSATGTPVVDGTPVAAYTNPTMYTSYSLAMGTLNAADFLVAVAQPNNAETMTAGGSWAVLNQQNAAYFVSFDQTLASSGATSFAASVASADVWTVACAAFKSPALAITTWNPTRKRRHMQGSIAMGLNIKEWF